MTPVLSFYLYRKDNQQLKQKLMNMLANLHRKYPGYTYSASEILKHNDMFNIFQLLYLQRWTKVAEIDNEGTNPKNYREEAIIYHRKDDSIKTVQQAVKHYESLRSVRFINSNTYRNLSAKTLFDMVLNRNKNHTSRRKAKLEIDDTTYEKIPVTFVSDYEVAKLRNKANGFKPIVNVVAKNKQGKPVINKKTGKPKVIPFRLDKNYPVTYVVSNRHSYKIARIYEKAIRSIPGIRWPVNKGMQTELLQMMVKEYRDVLAKYQRGARPIVYAVNFQNTVQVPYYAIARNNDGNYSYIVEKWTIGYHQADNKRVFNNLMSAAMTSRKDIKRKHYKPGIQVFNRDGMQGIQKFQAKNGQMMSNRRLAEFIKPNSDNKYWKNSGLVFDSYFPHDKGPVIDPKTGQVMKPSKVIKIGGNIRHRKAKKIRHQIEQQRKL